MCFFFVFHVVFSNFFTVPVEIENVRLRLAPVIPTGVSITVSNDAIEMLPLVPDKTIKYLSMPSKGEIYLLSLLLINSLSLISATK